MSRFFPVAFVIAVSALAAAGAGVIVESVEPGRGAAVAGIEPGLRLLRWERLDGDAVVAAGPLDSPFELARVEIEQAPHGAVRLVAAADTFELPPEEWRLAVRPDLGPALADRVDALLAAIDRNALDAALAEVASIGSNGTVDAELEAWLYRRTGDALGDAGAWPQSDEVYDAAVARADERGRTALVAALRRAQGELAERHKRNDEAEVAYRSALAALESSSDDDLAVADLHVRLGMIAFTRGDLDSARPCFERALAIDERLAPASYATAKTINSLGMVAFRGGELDGADRLWRRALSINERLAPEGRGVTNLVNNLGVLSWRRGDLAGSEAYLSRALTLRSVTAPESRAVAAIMSNLGGVTAQRGNLPLSESYLKRAVDLMQRLDPDGVTAATSLNNLGNLNVTRGDPRRAREYYERSLAIKRKLAPRSILLSHTLNNLAGVAMELGDLDTAEKYAAEALAIREEHAPDGVVISQSHHLLGDLERRRGNPAAARRHYERGLALLDRLAPDSLEAAMVLHSLGELAVEQGDEGAAALHRRALAIREQRAPGSMVEAESAAALARLHRDRGAPAQALARFTQAVAALEAQHVRYGGVEEDRAAFRARNLQIYRDAIDLLVELGRHEEALLLLERSRARGLLTLLAERDLVFSADLPGELDLRRRRLAAEYDRIQEQLAELTASADAEPVNELLASLEALRRERGELFEAIREAAPRLAALQQPVALDLARTREALDPGTALLSYGVGAAKTHLFVVDAGRRLRVHTISVGEDELRRRVAGLRETIESSAGASDGDELRRRAEPLYRMLVGPAETWLAGAKRIVIVPEGPLHLLPFAALVRPDGSFLIEWQPLHVVASATLYAELRRARRDRAKTANLLAFGDPSYPTAAGRGTTGDAVLGSLVAKGRSVRPLPATRHEVLALKQLYGDDAQTWLGPEATEGRAKAIDRSVRLVHFAAHAFVDERFPLDSAIALSIPERYEYGRDNGLLQAWEIFETVRIDADLVTLSACSSALGQELAGEGIVGLTRAFQYAGARSVLASLWNVGDRSTAELMRRFYAYLRGGKSKDEALRAAQLDLIRGKSSGSPQAQGRRGIGRLAKGKHEDHRTPYHWAAFQLFGDWR